MVFKLLLILILSYSHGFRIKNARSHSLTKLKCKGTDENTNDKKKKSNTKFDRVIDDFIGKRYGAGEAFYGKRMSDLDEESYSELRPKKVNPYAENPPKENSIVIYGSLDSFGQYVIYELAEKGFNIRVLTDNLKRTVSLFGLPGNNVDIIEIKKDSSLETYAKAINGAQAIIFTGNFDPTINPLIGSCKAYNDISTRLIDLAAEGVKTKTLPLQKIINVSRFANIRGVKPSSPFEVFTSLSSGLYSSYQSLALELESHVRSSKIEYVIIRGPLTVELSREACRRDLVLSQDTLAQTASSTIGVLDLAECVTQALLLDTNEVTFTVSEEMDTSGDTSDEDQPLIASKAMESEYGAPKTRAAASGTRVARRAFFSILDADDSDMRSSYLIKPEEAYIAQIEEDRQLEKYWAAKFAKLKKGQL